jgi:hypothetical protein
MDVCRGRAHIVDIARDQIKVLSMEVILGGGRVGVLPSMFPLLLPLFPSLTRLFLTICSACLAEENLPSLFFPLSYQQPLHKVERCGTTFVAR